MMRTIGVFSFACYALLIAYLSLAPAPDVPSVGSDKLSHLLAYAGFAVLASGLFLSRNRYLLVCFAIILFSGLMEVAQHFVPGRDMSALDLLANILGVLIVVIAGRLMRRLGAASGPG